MRRFKLFYKDEKGETCYIALGKENKISKFKEEATIFTDESYKNSKILLDEKKSYHKFFISDFGLVIFRNEKPLFFTNENKFEDNKNDTKIFNSEESAIEKLIELKDSLNINDKIFIMKRLNDNYGWYIKDETTNASLDKFKLAIKLNTAIDDFYSLSDKPDQDDFVSLITKAIQLLK